MLILDSFNSVPGQPENLSLNLKPQHLQGRTSQSTVTADLRSSSVIPTKGELKWRGRGGVDTGPSFPRTEELDN